MCGKTCAPSPPGVVARRLSSLTFTCICGKTRGLVTGLAGVLSPLTFIPTLGGGRTFVASDEVAGELALFTFIFKCGRSGVLEAPEELAVEL